MSDVYTPEEIELLRQRAEIEAEARKDIHALWCRAVTALGFLAALAWGLS